MGPTPWRFDALIPRMRQSIGGKRLFDKCPIFNYNVPLYGNETLTNMQR
jgi:hypothetical protein